MLNRRHFIQSLAIAPWLCQTLVRGASNSGRSALIIGNSAYTRSRLANPTNDAKAIGELLQKATFDVDLHLDASRAKMLDAIERFGKRVASPDTSLALFYYAGHGAQLDWRNYLVPVGAPVASAKSLMAECIDLAAVLTNFSEAQRGRQDKTFVVILDACRDDPFGSDFRPSAKGLSQFDAPVGTLIAFATAPGKVALDGTGLNGLYTDNLIKELSRPDIRLEDALKRVRLNVRLASGGSQIPWESTSLEGDLYIFPQFGAQSSQGAGEIQADKEVLRWNLIKASQQAGDWIAYLREFPNGHFSEIAQTRLNRLLTIPANNLGAPPTTQRAQQLRSDSGDVEEGQAIVPPETAAAVSLNPYSAGRFPLARRFSVGDLYRFRDKDLLTEVVERNYKNIVTRIDEVNDRVELNNGKLVLDLMGNQIENQNLAAEFPQQFYPAELQVGNRWRLLNNIELKTGKFAGQKRRIDMAVRIDARERIMAPAGEFNAFRISADGWSIGEAHSIKLEIKLWVVPGVNMFIRRERIKRRDNRIIEAKLTELVALRQSVSGLAL
ncbi:caspase domain-containing protein [Zoogloea sp.]|uniref:caspase family protein n=1 Tax=Zoogloea sp. TaxID=49181 RepID=UPI0035B468DC